MMNSFLTADANAESGGNFGIGYHNRALSSAAGPFGITDATWGGLSSKYPQLGLSSANRFDPDANMRAATALQGEWSDSLRSKGLPVNNASLGLSSFLGPAAASSFLQADPNETVQAALERSVGPAQAARMIAANPGVLDGSRTVGQVLQFNQSRMGAGGAPDASTGLPAAPGGMSAAPQVPSLGTIQATPPPPIPSDFAMPVSGPVQAPQVDQSGHDGDPGIMAGLGMMGGMSWQDAMQGGLKGYQAAVAQQQENARADAQLQGETNNLNATQDFRAAQAAHARAQAWQELHPTISPDQALSANVRLREQDVQQRGQDATMQEAQARLEASRAMIRGAPQQFVVPGDDGSPSRTIEVASTPNGQVYTDLNSGQRIDHLPAGAVPMGSYNQQTARDSKVQAAQAKDIGAITQAGMDATNQMETLRRVQADANDPRALNGPGVTLSLGRLVDSLAGTSVFGDKTAEDLSKMDLGQLNWNSVRDSIHGTGGRLTQQEVGLLQKNFASVSTDPTARNQVIGVIQRSLQRQQQIANDWTGMDPTLRAAVLRTPGGKGVAEWQFGENQRLAAQQPQVDAGVPATSVGSSLGSPSGPRPPLSSFMK